MNQEIIYSELKDARDRLEELTQASMQNIDDVLQRYFHSINPETEVGTVLVAELPVANFSQWYKQVASTRVGMVGSAKLSWPLEMKERLSLQYQLIQNMAAGKIDLSNFACDFTHTGSNINDNNYAFVTRVIVPFHNDLIKLIDPIVKESQPAIAEESAIDSKAFIDPSRLVELKNLSSDDYDLTKILQLCRELDVSYQNGCYFSVAALTRTLIDHVAPIFGCSKFVEIANNYSGTKSFKGSMKNLQNSARIIGDAHLHTPIRASETLPTAAQVNFSNDVDVLLSEIVRVLK